MLITLAGSHSFASGTAESFITGWSFVTLLPTSVGASAWTPVSSDASIVATSSRIQTRGGAWSGSTNGGRYRTHIANLTTTTNAIYGGRCALVPAP